MWKGGEALKKFKDIHKGERCFIIGTGPSLNKTNLSLIRDEIIFGVNTLYTGLEKFKIKCKYYAVSDYMVWENHYQNILGLDTILFLSSGAADLYFRSGRHVGDRQKAEVYIIRELERIWTAGDISKDITRGVYIGETIIIDICLQVAYYMGFDKVYLLGCDCDYSGLHRFDGSITDNMGGRGVLDDWSDIFYGYTICKRAFEADGREIINATVGGKLEVFKRERLEDIV